MRMPRQIRDLLTLLVLLILTNVAYAELRLCNDSPFSITTAVGYHVGGSWESKGWWTLEPGACVLGERLRIKYNREIQDVLRTLSLENRIDILGFDACLMAMVEASYAMREFSDYMVGSEELIPSWGWNYKLLLGHLVQNPNISPSDLANLLFRLINYLIPVDAHPTKVEDIPNLTLHIEELFEALPT